MMQRSMEVNKKTILLNKWSVAMLMLAVGFQLCTLFHMLLRFLK